MKILGLFLGFSLWAQTGFAFINFNNANSSSPYCHDNQYVYFRSLDDCKNVGGSCSSHLKAGALREIESIYISETEKINRLYLFPGFSEIPVCHDRELKEALFIESSRFAYADEVTIIQKLIQQNIFHVGLYGTRFVIPKSLNDEDFVALQNQSHSFYLSTTPYIPERDGDIFEVIATGGEYGGGGLTSSGLKNSHNISVFESEIELWKSEEDSETDNDDEGVEI